MPEPLDPDWPAVGFHQLQDHHRILLPKLTSAHIDGYFKYRLASDSLLNSDIKAVEKGHKMVEGNKVYACSIHINKPNIYLTGIVGAAMKKKLNYNLKLKLDFNTSEIVNSHCECPSGKGPHGTCKHVAAVLIVMEKFINGGPLFISKSCTENLQAFHKPKKLFGGSPMKAKTLPGKRKCSLDDPRPPKYRRLTGYADHVRSTVLNYCSKSSKDIAIRYLWEKANIQAAALDHDYLKLPFTEYWVDNALSVTEADIKDIASKTTKQSASKQWYHHRRWRITASRFGEICKMTDRRNKKKLCQSFVAHSNLKSKAVIHGRQYESVAVRKFENQMNIKTKAAGFFISEDYPFLGASPDRLIGDDSIVEVKCPYTGRNSAISPSKMFPYLHKTSNEDGDFKLNPFSSYYSQIQGQLYITKRRYCFFVVYTFEDLFVQKLEIDNDYCNFCLLPKLKLFYEKYLRKYIADHM